MIRKMQTADIDETAGIWLDTNLKAHDFIPAEYWKGNYDAVKEMISQAEVYIYEDKSRIQGFAGLDQDYIAGIFVREEAQNRGKESSGSGEGGKAEAGFKCICQKCESCTVLSERRISDRGGWY